jgi:hypothetical protein
VEGGERRQCRQVYTGLAVVGMFRLLIPNEEPGEGSSLLKCDRDVLVDATRKLRLRKNK